MSNDHRSSAIAVAITWLLSQHTSNEHRPTEITGLFSTSQMNAGPSRSRDSSTQVRWPRAHRDHVTLLQHKSNDHRPMAITWLFFKKLFWQDRTTPHPHTPAAGMPLKSLKIRKSPWMTASQQMQVFSIDFPQPWPMFSSKANQICLYIYAVGSLIVSNMLGRKAAVGFITCRN